MSVVIETRVEGLKELADKIKRMNAKVGRTALRRSVGAGASVVRKAVRDRAPVYMGKFRKGRKPGTLKRAVVSKWARERSNDAQQTYVVTLRRGKREQAKNRDAYYWPWVEYGHRIVPRQAKGRNASIRARRRAANAAGGMVPPHPFVRPAFEASQGRAVEAIKQRLTVEVEKVAREP